MWLPWDPLTPHARLFLPSVPKAVGFNDSEVHAVTHPAEGGKKNADDLLRFYFFHKLLH